MQELALDVCCKTRISACETSFSKVSVANEKIFMAT